VDPERMASLLDQWLTLNYAVPSPQRPWFEWCYLNIPPRILVEELLTDTQAGAPIEHQFHLYVIAGKVRFIRVHWNRHPHRSSVTVTPHWEEISLSRFLSADCSTRAGKPSRPAHLPQMISIAETLGALAVDFVRVDLYDTPRGVVFGELTNYPLAGQGHILPAAHDNAWGSLWPTSDRAPVASQRAWRSTTTPE